MDQLMYQSVSVILIYKMDDQDFIMVIHLTSGHKKWQFSFSSMGEKSVADYCMHHPIRMVYNRQC